MKKFISVIFITFAFPLAGASVCRQGELAQKKVLVLSCKGGGGHTCAANAISHYLRHDYSVKVINVLSEVFGTCDPLRAISFGSADAEECYNFLLKYRCNFLLNLYNYCGLFIVKAFKEELVDVLYGYLKHNSCDILISITPYINGIAMDAAKRLNIPFIVIPTDLNSENFAYEIDAREYKKFNFILPFKDELLINRINNNNISQDKIKFIGYPLREDFFETKDIDKIKGEWQIPSNKPVAMILMGAMGSTATYVYCFRLSKYKKPLHIIICLGRSEWLKEKIQKIKFPDHITVSLVGFTDKISDLMSISDAIFTKTGTHSVCEAIQSCVPLILDSINISLEWENLNPEYIEKHRFGQNLTDYYDIHEYLDNILQNKNYKNNLLAQERYNFAQGLREIILGLLQ